MTQMAFERRDVIADRGLGNAELIGGDQDAKLATWHRWKELFGLARFAVFARPGEEMANIDAPEGGVIHVAMAPMPISASTIRARLARGESVAGLLPAAVTEYIQLHRLYH